MAAVDKVSEFAGLDIAVLIPCHNEEAAIGAVVESLHRAVPQARIVVFDNASSDATVEIARAAGAHVRQEHTRGKGNVVRRMFADIEADIYVMIDGDGTYEAEAAPRLIRTLLSEGADMVVGRRRGVTEDAGRNGHAAGNRVFNQLYRRLFGDGFRDIFSGFRAFSRRFVKSFPAVSSGFEIETEMSVHANQLRLPVAEIEVGYGARPAGSTSKLDTVGDGLRILRTFFLLLKETRPFALLGTIGGLLAASSLVLAWPLLLTWLETGMVPRFPTAILATGMMLLAFLLGTAGLILDSLARSRIEAKRILYLTIAPLRTQ